MTNACERIKNILNKIPSIVCCQILDPPTEDRHRNFGDS